MNLSVEQLNELFEDLYSLRNGSNRVEKVVEKEIDYDYPRQGEEGLAYEVYRTEDPDTYIRLEIRTDSYGEDEYIAGIKFVKKVTKTVSAYE